MLEGLGKKVEDLEENFFSLHTYKIWIRIRISLKSGIRIRLKTFGIHLTVLKCEFRSNNITKIIKTFFQRIFPRAAGAGWGAALFYAL